MTQPSEPNIDKLIDMEWDIIEDMKKMLKDPELSATEKIRAANSLAYHASVLNKLVTCSHPLMGVGIPAHLC